MLCRWTVAATVFALTAPGTDALARTWHILNDGSGDAPTVQAGIDSAAVGDTVLVGPGTYLENLSIVGKDLVLKSEMGPAATILDGSGQQESVIYMSGQSRATVVEGVTITGGVGHLRDPSILGGGLYLDNGASPRVIGNRIEGNGTLAVTYGGGGLFTNTTASSPASPLIEGNIWRLNHAIFGGALALGSGASEIRGNVFVQNSGEFDGGAIYADFGSGMVTIQDNQFWENSAGDHGGAVAVVGSTGSEIQLVKNLIARNSAGGSSGFYRAGAAIWAVGIRGVIANNTLVENIGPSWTSCGGGGLSLERTPPDLDIYANLIALNQSCGITCASGLLEPQNILGENLLWMNAGGGSWPRPGSLPLLVDGHPAYR